MELSIIIVNYNVYDNIKKCIQSLFDNLTGIEYELLIVDNNSAKRDIDNITVDYPFVKYYKLNQNRGFAAANNYGFRQTSGEFILFLNPDTIYIENFLPSLIINYSANSQTGACGPMLLYEDMNYQTSSGMKMGFIFEFLEAFNLIEFIRKFFKKRYLTSVKEKFRVGWLSAACLLIKKDIFRKVTLFDESYFLNYEDIDLCYKLNEAGYQNYYFPGFKCIHSDHKSFGKNYELLVYSRYQSRLIFSKSHYGYIKRILIRTMHINGLLFRLLFTGIFYKGDEYYSRKRGYLMSLRLYLGLKKS